MLVGRRGRGRILPELPAVEERGKMVLVYEPLQEAEEALYEQEEEVDVSERRCCYSCFPLLLLLLLPLLLFLLLLFLTLGGRLAGLGAEVKPVCLNGWMTAGCCCWLPPLLKLLFLPRLLLKLFLPLLLPLKLLLALTAGCCGCGGNGFKAGPVESRLN
jgi:hypothetical protein